MNQSNNTNRQWQIISSVFVLLFFTTLTFAEPVSADREIAESLNTQWNEAFNSADPASVAALYEENAILSPGNGEVLVGQDAIEGLFRSFIENGLHDHRIEVVSAHVDGDTLHEVAKWSAYGVAKDGERPVYRGILLNIFQRDGNGQWKSHAHVWNASN